MKRILFLFLALASLCLAPLAHAQQGVPNASKIIVKYRYTEDARTAFANGAAHPETFSLGERPIARVKRTFEIPARTNFPAENYLTFTLADSTQMQHVLAQLHADPTVEYAQPDYTRHLDESDNTKSKRITQSLNAINRAKKTTPKTEQFISNDSLYGEQWNLQTIQAPDAWETETGDTNVLIGFVDTGLDFFHKDFMSAAGLASVHINAAEDINHDGIFEPWSKDTTEMVNGVMRSGDLDGIDEDSNGFVDDVIGYNFVNQPSFDFTAYPARNPIPYDDESHGTAIAGVMCAQTNNAIGIAGIAFHCKLLVLKAFEGQTGADDDIAAAIIYGADFAPTDGARVRVINCSFGDVYNSPIMHDAIQYANQKGIVVVCSSGNSGGTGAHYPSNYPECISVGASNVYDGVDPSSQGGNALTLVAPGDNVESTQPGNTYSLVSGTSVASPHVSAAAALLISHTPSLTVNEVRGILQTSTDDIDHDGWDEIQGAGRLNLNTALQSFASAIVIASPRQDTGIAENSVPIIGTAATTYFSFYQVYIGMGDDPATWTLLKDTTRRQEINDTLATWNAAAYPDTSYIARLVVTESNGETVENRTRFFMERSPATATRFQILDCFDQDKHALIVDARSSQLTTFTVYFRPKNSGLPFTGKKQVNMLTHNHYVELTYNDLTGGVPYDCYAEFLNSAGAVTRVDSGGATFTITRSSEAFPLANFTPKTYSLPPAILLNQTANIYNNNTKDIALMDETVGRLKVYSFANGAFTARDSFAEPFNPRGIGETRSDGLLQIWTQSAERNILFSQTAAGGSPLQSIAFGDTVANSQIAVAMANFAGGANTPSNLIAYSDSGQNQATANDSTIVIYKYQATAYVRMGQLPDPTPPSADGNPKFLSTPMAAIGDFNGDGRIKIVAGDGAANFFMYEYNAATGAFTLIFQDIENLHDSIEQQDAYVVEGDFNGDGVADFVEGFHTSLNYNADNEYNAPYWTFKMFSWTGSQYQNVWTERVFGVSPPSSYTSGMAAGDLNNKKGDELFVNPYPNSFIFTWDSVTKRMYPMQYFPYGSSNSGIIADFDGNGLNEIGFNIGSRTNFYEYANTAAAPPTPVNFTGIPYDSNKALLGWNASQGATNYVIYRAVFLPTDTTLRFTAIATITTTSFIDSTIHTLRSDSLYAYYIVATGASGSSAGTQYITVIPHPRARLTRITDESQSGIGAHFSFLMPETALQPSSFSIDNIGIPSSVITQSDSSLALVFPKPFAGGTYTLRVHNLFDRYGEPVDTLPGFFTMQSAATQQDSLYILSMAINDAHHLTLIFSCPLDSAAASNPDNYSIQPRGTFVAARIDSVNRTEVHLTLDPLTPIGAFGKDWTVHAVNLASSCGTITLGAGSYIGVMLTQQDLSQMFVYPDPCRIDQNDHLTFANLTPTAQIWILTISGKQIGTVTEQQANGGADWNLRDNNGNLIQSGVYLYYATGKNSEGNDVPPKTGKFAVVR